MSSLQSYLPLCFKNLMVETFENLDNILRQDLDSVFFFKYLHGHVDLTRSFNYYFSFVASQTRQACSALNLKINNNRTATFRDYYFNRIANYFVEQYT